MTKVIKFKPILFIAAAIILTITACKDAQVAQSHLPDGFVYLDEVLVNAKYDVRYYTTNNFLGVRVDGYLAPRVILTKEAANMLALAEKDMEEIGLGFLIFDGFRPQQAVDHFVRWAEDLSDTIMKSKLYPDVAKEDLFELGYIAKKSGHSRGSTVDLTLFNLATGDELDMGSVFDFFGEISNHNTDLISAEQTQNRNVLRDVMLKHNFRLYIKEWWHYTLENEPFPDEYFNFPVK